jgi:hypothetical protein
MLVPINAVVIPILPRSQRKFDIASMSLPIQHSISVCKIDLFHSLTYFINGCHTKRMSQMYIDYRNAEETRLSQ